MSTGRRRPKKYRLWRDDSSLKIPKQTVSRWRRRLAGQEYQPPAFCNEEAEGEIYLLKLSVQVFFKCPIFKMEMDVSKENSKAWLLKIIQKRLGVI